MGWDYGTSSSAGEAEEVVRAPMAFNRVIAGMGPICAIPAPPETPRPVSFTVMWRITVGGWWRLVWSGEVSGWGCGGFGGGVGLVQGRALLCREQA